MRVIQCTALIIALAVAAGGLTDCAIERAQVAHKAKSRMVGLAKEQVLSCMGVPASKAAEGMTEVRSYNSGNDPTQNGDIWPEHCGCLALRHSAIRSSPLLFGVSVRGAPRMRPRADRLKPGPLRWRLAGGAISPTSIPKSPLIPVNCTPFRPNTGLSRRA
jgi:hypothetical protein